MMLKPVILIALAVSLFGCRTAGVWDNSNSPSVKTAGDAIESIEVSANEIEKTAPEVKPQTTNIKQQTSTLRNENEKTEALVSAHEKTVKALEQAKSESQRFINYISAAAYALGILAIIAGFFLKAPSVIFGGVGALVGASVALYVFKWGWVLGLAALIAAAIYYFFKTRKALVQTVATTEMMKVATSKHPDIHTPLFGAEDSLLTSAALSVQSPSTKKLVKQIRNKMPKTITGEKK